MRKKLSSLVLIACLILSTLFLAATPAYAQQTREWGGVCTNDTTATGVATIQGFQCLIGNLLQIAVSGVGLAGFVMFIIGSFKYLMSGGNAKGTDEGSKTMTYAVAGLVLSISAFFILNVLSEFTGVSRILNFTIPNPTAQPNFP